MVLRMKILFTKDMGLALTVEQFHELADRVRKAGVKFIIEPHLRFAGEYNIAIEVFYSL
jgi:extradiol dioxygenase family protein